jgi:hypothetical protein
MGKGDGRWSVGEPLTFILSPKGRGDGCLDGRPDRGCVGSTNTTRLEDSARQKRSRSGVAAGNRWTPKPWGEKLRPGIQRGCLPTRRGDCKTNPILIKPAWKSWGNEAKNEANLGGGLEGWDEQIWGDYGLGRDSALDARGYSRVGTAGYLDPSTSLRAGSRHPAHNADRAAAWIRIGA